MSKKIIWKHEEFRDVGFEVYEKVYIGPEYQKWKIRWWNISGFNKPTMLDIDVIKINNIDLSKYKPYIVDCTDHY